MRILIYSETPEAAEMRDRLLDQGHTVSLRNPQYFDADSFSKDFDKAITWDASIAAAMQKAGKQVQYFGDEPVEVEAEEPIEPQAAPDGGLHEETVAAVEKKVKAARKPKAKK